MELKFTLSYSGKTVGKVCVVRLGMYYDIECRFTNNGAGRFHLIAVSDSGETDLGVCVRCASCFELKRRLPIKSVGEGLRQFYITSDVNEITYPISPNKPFPLIDRLESAILVIKGNEKRIRL